MSKFFNRNWKAGFTLVELIVVIAILAILAGIAIPVYSGYIKKANEAADNQLLAAVNTAFGAACLENQTDPRTVNAAASLDGNGATSVNPFDEQFQAYFAGNGNFKVYKSLVYIKSDGVFAGSKVGVVNNGDGTYTVTLANGQTVTYTVSDDAIAAVQASTFGQNIGMGVVLSDIGGMVDSLTNVLGNGDFIANILGNSMGMDLEAMGITAPYNTPEMKAKLSNAVVLAVASQVADGTAAQVTGLMSSSDNLSGLVNTMENFSLNGNTLPQQVGQITSFYAMATAFAGSDAAEGWSTTVGGKTYNAQQYYDLISSNIATISTSELGTVDKGKAIMKEMAKLSDMMMTSEGSFNTQYSDYVSFQLAADAAGFEEAMQAVGTNSDALVATGAISSGYDSVDVNAILNLILGG